MRVAVWDTVGSAVPLAVELGCTPSDRDAVGVAVLGGVAEAEGVLLAVAALLAVDDRVGVLDGVGGSMHHDTVLFMPYGLPAQFTNMRKLYCARGGQGRKEGGGKAAV